MVFLFPAVKTGFRQDIRVFLPGRMLKKSCRDSNLSGRKPFLFARIHSGNSRNQNFLAGTRPDSAGIQNFLTGTSSCFAGQGKSRQDKFLAGFSYIRMYSEIKFNDHPFLYLYSKIH